MAAVRGRRDAAPRPRRLLLLVARADVGRDGQLGPVARRLAVGVRGLRRRPLAALARALRLLAHARLGLAPRLLVGSPARPALRAPAGLLLPALAPLLVV